MRYTTDESVRHGIDERAIRLICEASAEAIQSLRATERILARHVRDRLGVRL